MNRVALPLYEADRAQPSTSSFSAVTGPRDIRAVKTLRISVTDRCNFRCVYCMPAEKVDWLPREQLLTFDEIAEVVRVAVSLGIHGFKLTGGEPLARRDLPQLVALLRAIPGVAELSMTTNGSLLAEHADELKQAGLDRLTVSLDTLVPRRFRRITRGGDISQVWAGIAAARAAGFPHPKINCVAMRGINDDEFARFAALTFETDLSVRFIEYMPLGRTALGGEYEARFVGEHEIRRAIAALGKLRPARRDAGEGPAVVWRLPDAAGRIGFISAMSKPFCDTCNRLRLTATGQLRSCLFNGGEVELRPLLRPRARPAAMREAFVRCVAFKPEVHDYFGNRQMSQIGG
jgi:cyclic pyranopterin phosphate synthase